MALKRRSSILLLLAVFPWAGCADDPAGPRPTIEVDPVSVTLSALPGQSEPVSGTVTISNGGGAALTGLGTVTTYGAGQPEGWLDVTLSATTAPAALMLAASAATLGAGTYTATVHVTAGGATNSPRSVFVTLMVAGGDGHLFRYAPPAGAPAVVSVSLRGSFNGWGETPMAQLPDGSWRVHVPLGDGRHQYKFFINGDWPADMCFDQTWGHAAHDYWIDPDADGCDPDGHGGQNAYVQVGEVGLGFVHQPTSPAHVSAADGRVSIRFTVTAGRMASAVVTVGADTFPAHLQLRQGSQEIWRALVPEGSTAYGVTATASTGTESFGPYGVPGTLFRAVPWVGEAVGYQIFPERFWNGDRSNDEHGPATDAYHYLHPSFRYGPPILTEAWNGPMEHNHCCHQYFGGDLQGVAEKLDHLDALGVSLVYLNPIFTSGSAHGYDTYDYFEIAPNFGDEQTVRDLLGAARGRGMRLMWDFVPNHVGVGHWAFQHAVQHGDTSAYWNWFYFRVPHTEIQVGNNTHYDGWWGVGELPELNTAHAAVHAHLMEATRYWTEVGFDGIRVDVPESIRNRAQFFPAFRQAAKAVNPDVYLVGEVWGRNPGWLRGDEFDSLMNYAIGLDVIRMFALGWMTAGTAAQDMTRLYADYPEAATAMQFNIISSHDTSRLLTLLGGGTMGMTPSAIALGRQRLASALLYALPGVPITFQGDECAFLGVAGSGDQHRYPFQWDACDLAMLSHYRGLGELKRNLPALRSAAIRVPAATGSVLSFYRGEPGVGEVLALFNGANESRTVALPAGNWADAATGQAVNGSADLGPLGWLYLERR
jgi:cyclomaltodextrinase / maltogenic alpha-amylase / neopullulanase